VQVFASTRGVRLAVADFDAHLRDKHERITAATASSSFVERRRPPRRGAAAPARSACHNSFATWYSLSVQPNADA
jgi:hypothetical protein